MAQQNTQTQAPATSDFDAIAATVAWQAFVNFLSVELPKLRTGDVFPVGARARYKGGKASNGKRFLDSGDELAQRFRGCTLLEIAELYASMNPERNATGWIAFYTTDRVKEGKRPLNDGMVRMNIGNRIRALLNDK
jgi:hypothetical protein